jgi:Peptidase propeptide and YPEB domain
MRTIPGAIRGAAIGALMLTSMVASAQKPADKEQAALAAALAPNHIGLEAGLTSAAANGKPISAKYEYEEGKLQLSVYTEKAGAFFEVVVDHHSGKVIKAEKITEGDDLTHAKAQSLAISKAKQSLNAAVAKALTDNPGYSAVSAMPAVNGGTASAEITLIKGRAFKTVTQPLT